MLPNLAADDRDGALTEICGRMESEGFTENGAALVDHALRREAIMPTVLENGIAFPHVRGVEGGGVTLALAVRPQGIRFSTTANTLTRIVFFVVIPSAASAFYLKLLSGLTQSFESEANREKLLSADTPETLWKALCQSTRKTIV
jgi:mannitol/fructose-specific phosphotransferase system IIA component (Ntr-type)